MSADLLAEVGPPRSGAVEHDKKKSQSSPVSRQQNGDLVMTLVNEFGTAPLQQEEKTGSHNLWRKENNGTEVLFDCSTDQFGLNDEFGDFEYGEQERAQSMSSSLIADTMREKTTSTTVVSSQALLDLEESAESSEMLKYNVPQDLEEEWGDFSAAISREEPKLESRNLPKVSSRPSQAVIIDETTNEDSWEPFKDGEIAELTRYTNNEDGHLATCSGNYGTSFQQIKQRRESSSMERKLAIPSKDEIRPTNIPPPAMLIQVLPVVFHNLDDAVHAQGQIQSIEAIIHTHKVACYLIAGRTLRWKRDSILNQNTRIGPAALGGKTGGMKLTAIDKSESRKEEREVVDVVQAWERHAHFFNSTLHKAGLRRPLMTLSERLRARLVKGDGLLTSQYPCTLCGLKREERVWEADISVNDSFGEFWIEHWGHRDCKDFWHKNHALLPHR